VGAISLELRFGIVSELPMPPEPPGGTAAHIAYGHVNGRRPWASAGPRAAFSTRVNTK
jgi:hypothetical protein